MYGIAVYFFVAILGSLGTTFLSVRAVLVHPPPPFGCGLSSHVRLTRQLTFHGGILRHTLQAIFHAIRQSMRTCASSGPSSFSQCRQTIEENNRSLRYQSWIVFIPPSWTRGTPGRAGAGSRGVGPARMRNLC